MYLMYVDESGDTGVVNSPTQFFTLSGIVVHESRWRDFIEALVQFKKTQQAVHNLPIREEIHASVFMRSKVAGLEKHVRLAILRNSLDELAKLDYISVTNVIIDKNNQNPNVDIFDYAWKTLFQRFENTLRSGNFPGGFRDDHGIVITDATAGEKLARLVRKMAVYNPIPNQPRFGPGYRNMPITRVIEDPYGKDSRQTLAIQMADVVAYFLLQKLQPNSYIKRKSSKNYFDRLAPVLNTRAATADPLGIVRL